jgi:hypothetical protein
VTPVVPEGLARVLAWAHPVWMLLWLATAAAALRLGLRLRRARLAGLRRPPELRRRHQRLARPAVAALLVGFAAGPVSSVLLRGWDAFHSFHGFAGFTAAALFACAAVLGQRLSRGRSRAVDAHALLGTLAVLIAALAAVAGFALLP